VTGMTTIDRRRALLTSMISRYLLSSESGGLYICSTMQTINSSQLHVITDMQPSILMSSAPQMIRYTAEVRANDLPPSKEASKRQDANAGETIQVYTDGYLHDKEVGAAAILYRNGRLTRTLKLHLGPADQRGLQSSEGCENAGGLIKILQNLFFSNEVRR
jgi:hypothetical protein